MSLPIKTIIIDDEKDARNSIRLIIENAFPQINIIDEAHSVESAVAKIKKHSPDLLFLDITLTDGTGFDILSHFQNPTFKVIFITGHNELAVKAFRYNALNFILKPINPDEIIEAVTRSLAQLQQKHIPEQLKYFLSQYQEKKTPQTLFLETHNDTFIVKIQNIIQCKKENTKTIFFLTNHRKITIEKSFSYYKDLLLSHHFCQTHHDHIINLHHVIKYNRTDGDTIVMTDDIHIPLLPSKKKYFLKKITAL